MAAHFPIQAWQRRWGLARSILIYYGIPWRHRQLTRFYSQFIGVGDLCFDIGAHVGNRTRAWSALGGRVVAVEPMPHFMGLLQHWYGNQPDIRLVEAAVGSQSGVQELWVSERTPTVTTLSTDWMQSVQQTASFSNVRWETVLPVQVTTLDELIREYGEPVFCKIDVEGYERIVLDGLSQPLKTLSFEYVPATVDLALACIERLSALGAYEYNWTTGERHLWQSPTWLSAMQMSQYLEALDPESGSGDIYARRAGDT